MNDLSTRADFPTAFRRVASRLVSALAATAIFTTHAGAQFVAPLPQGRPNIAPAVVAATVKKAARQDTVVFLKDVAGREMRPMSISALMADKVVADTVSITPPAAAGLAAPATSGDGGNEVPNLILPQINSGFASDRAYVAVTAFSGHGSFNNNGFNLDITGAKVVSSSDTGDVSKRKGIRDVKSLVTTLVENSGDVGFRLYGCPSGCKAPLASRMDSVGYVHKLLFGLAGGSYTSTDTTDKDQKIAFGPIAQYYIAFRLDDGSSSTAVGSLLVGARAGIMSLTGGGMPNVSDTRTLRYVSETVSLVVHNIALFGITLTQTQNSLKQYVPRVQFTTSANLK